MQSSITRMPRLSPKILFLLRQLHTLIVANMSEEGAVAVVSLPSETAKLSGTQIGILVAGFVALLFVLVANFVVRNRRWLALTETKSGLVTSDFLCLRDLPRQARDLLTTESARERMLKEVPAWRVDCGWGRPGSEHAGVHFKSSVASSLWLVEGYATRKDPRLAVVQPESSAQGDAAGLPHSSGACDVDEYFTRLRRSFPDLGVDLCRQYIGWYRKARSPGREFSEHEYDAFIRVLAEIQRRIEPAK